MRRPIVHASTVKPRPKKMKHASCSDCTHEVEVKVVVPYSDWSHGGVLYCKTKKYGDEYNGRFNKQAQDVMGYLYRTPASDYELVYEIRTSHQLGAVRCMLRDAGVVEAVGEVKINGSTHTVWSLNEQGRRIWEGFTLT